MSHVATSSISAASHVEQEADEKASFGFWTYILTDCLLFATLFATFAVLRPATYGGPGPRELFSLPYVLAETMLLLTSSFTFGMAMLGRQAASPSRVLPWMLVTYALGLGFVVLEVREFVHLIAEGHGPQANAFLSGFFGLVGTHGLHVSCGLVWMGLMMVQVWKRGLTPAVSRKLFNLSLFWHFLDIIWIFVFTFVYLLGVL